MGADHAPADPVGGAVLTQDGGGGGSRAGGGQEAVQAEGAGRASIGVLDQQLGAGGLPVSVVVALLVLVFPSVK